MRRRAKALNGRTTPLRTQAAQVLAARPRRKDAAVPDDHLRLIHELEVHHVELEMQNEELRAAQSKIEKSRAKYAELYDTVPVGYFSLSKRGIILEANLTAARMLGTRRDRLLRAPLAGWLVPESRKAFFAHLSQIFRGARQEERATPLGEVVLRSADGTRFHARLESVLASQDEEHGCCCRTAVLDTTKQRQAEAAHWRVLHQLVTAQEEERGRIARELHDEFGQELAAISLGLKRIEEELPKHSPARPCVGQSLIDVGSLLRNLHRLVWNLRPPALDDLGLPAALQQHLDEWSTVSGIPVHFHCGGLDRRRLRTEVETTLYRIAQEALTNVSKHAQADRVNVLLEARRDHVGLIIEDDGKGFKMGVDSNGAPKLNGHFGLAGMRERAQMAAGTVEVESVLGAGTTVFVRIPIAAKAAVNNQPLNQL